MQGLAAAVRGDSEAVLEFKQAAHNSEEPESATEDDAAAHAVSTPRPVASGCVNCSSALAFSCDPAGLPT